MLMSSSHYGNFRVDVIDDKTLTLDRDLKGSYEAGTEVYLIYPSIISNGSEVTIHGLNIDGTAKRF